MFGLSSLYEFTKSGRLARSFVIIPHTPVISNGLSAFFKLKTPSRSAIISE